MQSVDAPVDLVAFAPHPDDVELFCGGTMLVSARAGFRTAVVDLTEGELSTNGTPSQRTAERAAATELLGLATRLSLGLPDGRIGSDPEHGAAIVATLRELRPRVVLAPYWEDRHPDHAATGRLIRESCFFAGVTKAASSGDPHRPERVYWYMAHHVFEPSVVVDVTRVWQDRHALLHVYESQVSATDAAASTATNDPRFLELLSARASFYGAMVGVDRGEPFLLVGPLKLQSLPELAEPTPIRQRSSRYRAYL